MNQQHPVTLGTGIEVGRDHKLLLIAGPCQIESLDHCLMIASTLQEICAQLPINLIFKSSYDKANRSSLNGKRGLGVEKGLEILRQVKAKTGLAVLTDVHTAEQAKLAAEVVDVLQTPAFLCRQTDFLIAVGETGKPVNVKKGQFLAPEDMRNVADKIASSGNTNIMLCERGACFGYRDLVVDMRSLLIMREIGYPVIFDATHSVQQMGSGGSGEIPSSGGQRQYIAPLVRAAVATGVDGLFIECHEEPSRAPSDAACMLPLDQLGKVLGSACKIRESLGQ